MEEGLWQLKEGDADQSQDVRGSSDGVNCDLERNRLIFKGIQVPKDHTRIEDGSTAGLRRSYAPWAALAGRVRTSVRAVPEITHLPIWRIDT